MKRLAAACLTVVICGIAWAQSAPATVTWKWRDGSGRIVWSDTPPPGSVPEKDILERPFASTRSRANAAQPTAAASAASGAAAQGTPVSRIDPELEARRKKAADEQLAQQKAQDEKTAAAKAENCARARGHLAALNEGMRMTRTNEKGEREVLDDKQRAEEIQRTRGVIASDCR
ncbi:MAG: DUF4124 domain-containing protein [Aquincola sp.]|nr:DUF4124 domain-containing protein [Aquincola sp.]MDH4289935.1 DUF4124 domain-containing protein [Aquincola sp.]MDH5329613.1 DUF4124 domain-containing protein [Aquincola sp.]